MTKPLAAVLILLAGLLPARPAAGDVFDGLTVEWVDAGVPDAGGGPAMPGFRGYVLRVTSTPDLGPITRVNLSFGGIRGTLAHRWTNPSGTGFLGGLQFNPAVVPSPGPDPARNQPGGGVMSLDSHLLPAPPGGAWSGVGEEAADAAGWFATTDGHPVPSTPTVGYVRQPRPPAGAAFPLDYLSRLEGRLDIDPDAGVMQVDAAYVVTDYVAFATPGVGTVNDPAVDIDGVSVFVPEPGGMLLGMAASALALLRRPTGRRRATVQSGGDRTATG